MDKLTLAACWYVHFLVGGERRGGGLVDHKFTSYIVKCEKYREFEVCWCVSLSCQI